MIVSLDVVSKNFRLFNSGSNEWQSRDLLSEFVDHWKIIFVEKNQLKVGDKIGLGFPLTDIYYFSALIAASELGLRLVVLDIFSNSKLSQEFFPLDLFVSGAMLSQEKHDYYSTLSKQTEYWHIWDSYTTNNWRVLPRLSDQEHKLCLLLCTSSGTTAKPKKVEHSHKFLSNVSRRNADLFGFHGNVLHIRNLHHGSSLATYFIPSLMSDRCTGHYIFNIESDQEIGALVQYCVDYNINHIQFPYLHLAEHFLKQAVSLNKKFRDLTIYVLSYINPAWQSLVDACGITKIVSVFGCNETSGPLFINTLSQGQKEFDHRKFVAADDFYNFRFNDQGQLLVDLKDYNTSVVMQDSFEQKGNVFTHLGRNDFVRINDVVVNLFWLLELAKTENLNAQITIDRDREKLYLAVWDQSDLSEVTSRLNEKIKDRYTDRVSIELAKHLSIDDFMFGIKLNHEAIRDTFRKII